MWHDVTRLANDCPRCRCHILLERSLDRIRKRMAASVPCADLLETNHFSEMGHLQWDKSHWKWTCGMQGSPKTRETQGNAGNRGHITWFQAMAVFLEASSTTLCSPERCCRGNCWVDMLRFTVLFSWEGTAEGICGSKSILTKTTTDCWTTTETHAERYWQIRIGCVDVLSSWWLNCHWPHSLAFRLPNCWHGILRALAWL